MDFTEDQIRRYARHIILPEVGGVGQSRLMAARVLVVGAGGLGAPVLEYLAAAGVGTLGIVDFDTVDLSNLQRQVIHDTPHVGAPKVHSAAARIALINPEVAVEPHAVRLAAGNAMALVSAYDLVVDGTDSFAARYLLNDACHLAGRPLVHGALLRFEGQVAVFRSHAGPDAPCYRCLFPEPPAPGIVPSCSEAGVLGALAGLVGTLQAVEALKLLLDIGEPLAGRLLLVDALAAGFHTMAVPRDPACALCGEVPTIRDLSGHE